LNDGVAALFGLDGYDILLGVHNCRVCIDGFFLDFKVLDSVDDVVLYFSLGRDLLDGDVLIGLKIQVGLLDDVWGYSQCSDFLQLREFDWKRIHI